MRAGRSGSARTSTTACSHSRERTCGRRRTGASRPWRPRRMPRTLTVGADRRRAVFIEDRDDAPTCSCSTSRAARVPERLTTGRDPMPWWDDTPPRLSPDGSTVAYADDGHVWLVPTAGGPPRKLVEGGSPRWIDDRRLVISVERDEDTTTRLAVVDVDDPWPRRLAVVARRPRRARRRGRAPRSHPTGPRWPTRSRPRADLNRSSEIRVATVEGGEVRRLTGVPDMHDGGAGMVARRPDDRVRVRAQRVLRAAPRGARRRGRPAAHERRRRPPRARLAPGRHAGSSPSRGDRNRFSLVSVDVADGSAEELAPAGARGTGRTGPRRATSSAATRITRRRASSAA